jgi:[NiFe] hydrogenase diaphorase moiety large subunit
MVQILREVQEACDWISPEAIDRLQTCSGCRAPRSRASPASIPFFYTEPRGKYRVLFSDNITDRMLGSKALMERLCNNLWIERGKVSEDGLVSVGKTACTGMCDQGPALLVNNYAIGGVDRNTHRRDRRTDPQQGAAEPSGRPSSSRSRTTSGAPTSCSRSDLKPGDALRAPRARAPSDGLMASNMRSWREGCRPG